MMKKRQNGTKRTLLPLLLALLLAIGNFGWGLAPEAHADGEADGVKPAVVYRVSTVDELLAAIGPDRVIQLEDGTYNLT